MTSCVHQEGRRHDCACVDSRDHLVLLAEAITNARHGAEPVEGSTKTVIAAGARRWDATFHSEMRRLTLDPFVRARHGQDAFGGAS